jgi:hypothetical protein
MLLNSTLQPILEVEEGGGLKRSEFQLVDCKFSKWLVVSSFENSDSSCSLEKVGIGSLENRDAMWKANLSSSPP